MAKVSNDDSSKAVVTEADALIKFLLLLFIQRSSQFDTKNSMQ